MAPGGRLLGALNSLDPDRVAGVLAEALEAWECLPPGERRLAPDVAERVALEPWAGVDRWESSFPDDGLILRATLRDLPGGAALDGGDPFAALPAAPRADADPPPGSRANLEPTAGAAPEPNGDPTAERGAWNLDFAWFRADELADLVPPDLAVGATHAVPAPLVERLVRFHLVDSVRGQTWAFDAGDVERAELRARAVAREAGALHVELEGRTRAVSHRRWRTWGGRAAPTDAPHERGVAARLRGRATLADGRFTRFDLVALGDRWGGSTFNGRRDAPPSLFGVCFRLARPIPAERVAPAFLSLYGWNDATGGGCAPLEPDAPR